MTPDRTATRRASVALGLLTGRYGRELTAAEVRRFDDCFENGESDAVVREFVRLAALHKAETGCDVFDPYNYPAARFVDRTWPEFAASGLSRGEFSRRRAEGGAP